MRPAGLCLMTTRALVGRAGRFSKAGQSRARQAGQAARLNHYTPAATHRLLSSSFWGLPYIILNINKPQKGTT